jgi:peptidoglycan/LPS O-acetylase OafA/YrhL
MTTGTTKVASRFYRPELDVLRFGAFLTVFITHVMSWKPDFYIQKLHVSPAIGSLLADAARAGKGGVVLFFMLSSYLITALLIREHDRTGKIDLKAFYVRRILRIWPLYFFFVGAAALILYLLGDPIPRVHVLGFMSFTENWVIFFRKFPALAITPLWSVSVEEQFYLIWPIAFIVCGMKRMWILPVLCFPVAIAARWYLSRMGAIDDQFWQCTFSHVDSIAVGALLAYFFRAGLPTIRAGGRAAMILTGILIPVCARGSAPEVIRYPLVTLSCALILVGVMGWDLPKSKVTDAFVYLGKISFGLYVFHLGYITIGDWLYPHIAFVFTASFAATLITAAASYRYLEMPFLRMKEKFAVIESRKP